MRSRTEQVTTTLADSENEDDPSLEDSEEDWKPEKKAGRGGSKAAPKGGAKRKSAGTKSRAAKKSKKEESESEEEPDEDEEDEEDEDDEDYDESDDGGSARGNKSDSKSPKKARGVSSLGKNQPDKDGNLELYLFKNDLTKDYRTDSKLCMWRRDGASLLQKYIVVKPDPDDKELIFNASSVYSCWEEKRKNDFFQIKVKILGDKKDGKVKVVNLPELEQFATEDRPKVDTTPQAADEDNAGADDDEGECDEDDEEGEDGFEEEE